ncbi:MAG: TolC family protein [Acidobacteriia bacterium]|nr:TolC family protein [Terriglobia bacterium]
MMARQIRAATALFLAALLTTAPVLAQQAQAPEQRRRVDTGPDYSQGRGHFPNLLGPYTPLRVPAPVLTNSPQVEQMIRDGKLYLSLQDAIMLALENNLDIQVQRYIPWIAETDVLRSLSGGATRGLAGTGTAAVLGAIPSASFDPQLTIDVSWDQREIPINNPFLAGTGVIVDSITNRTIRVNSSFSKGFPTGTGLGLTFNNNRQSTTSAGAFLNPSVSSSLFLTVSQQLLNGFGLLPNTRFIRIARNSKRAADLQFANQVIATVTQVQNLYWDLVFAREDVLVKQRSVELAEKLYQDNRRQVEIGTLAPIEVVRAEAEVARTRQDLIVAQTFLLQQQMLLKNAITKNPMDPLVQLVEVIPTDAITSPPQVEVLPLQDAVKEAWEKRPDVRQAEIDLENRGINVKATRNALLPTLSVFAQWGAQGLAGNSLVSGTPFVVPGTQVVDSSGNPVPNLFVPRTITPVAGVNTEGLPTALEEVINNRFPTYSAGFTLNVPIRNRSAQADAARALLEQRQAETRLRQLQNNVVVEVRNAQIALEQSRARVEAAQKARELAERTLDAEQKKYQLGASTIFFVIQAQRDLAQAQAQEIRAMADLLKARVEFDRALGRTLEVHNIEIADALDGQIERVPNIPGRIEAALLPAGAKY